MSPAATLPADYFELTNFLETFHPRLRRYSALLNVSQVKMDTLAADTATLRRAAVRSRVLSGESHYAGIYVDTLPSGSGAWVIAETSYYSSSDAEETDFPAETSVAAASRNYAHQAMLTRINDLVAQIKAHPRYTEEVGRALGFLSPAEQEFVYSSVNEGGHSSTVTSIGLKR